jgi:hypothetical protein
MRLIVMFFTTFSPVPRSAFLPRQSYRLIFFRPAAGVLASRRLDALVRASIPETKQARRSHVAPPG